MITYFKDKNNISKRKNKNYKTLTTILKSFDKFVIIAKTSSSITLSPTGISLIVIPISTGIACGLTVGNKLIYEITMQKHNKYKEQYGTNQQTTKYFEKLYRKSLQDNLIGNSEKELLCKTSTKILEETKTESFLYK